MRDPRQQKRWFLEPAVALGLAVLGCPALAWGQALKLTLKMEHPSFLQYEVAAAFVTIANDSDRVAVLQETTSTPEVVVFHVRPDNQRDVEMPRLTRNPIVSRLVVRPDEQQTILVDLSSWYDIRRPGRYLVKAGIRWFGKEYWSNTDVIDIVDGIEMASVTRSVPGYPERLRTYSLRYWGRSRQEHFFLTAVERETGTSYGVFPLGPGVRVPLPTLEVDRSGGIRVIHRIDRDRFVHSYFKAGRDSVLFIDSGAYREDGTPYPASAAGAGGPP